MSKFHLLIPFLSIILSLFSPQRGEVYGPVSRADIITKNPEWKTAAAAYIPDWEAISFLQGMETPVHIEVYLGTWCPDCASHVSQLFKIMDSASNPLLSASYIALPRDPEARAPFLKGEDIGRLPTFVVLSSGTELGRIVEHPSITLEEDLVDLLRSGEDAPLDYDFFMSNYHADMDVDCTECHLSSSAIDGL